MICLFKIILVFVLSIQPATYGMERLRNYLFPSLSSLPKSKYQFMTAIQLKEEERRARIKQQNIPDYTLNLQWINIKLNPEQQYIHPSSNSLSIRKNLLLNLYSWARKNPDAQGVVLWYDSQLTPPAAVENTRKIIANDRALMHLFKQKTAPILLKDVRQLPEVKANPEAFSEQSPIYYRVDLLRAIAAYNAVQENPPPQKPIEVKTSLLSKAKKHLPSVLKESIPSINLKKEPYAYVHADIDMTPSEAKEFFDMARGNLRRYGMVMAKDQTAYGYENSFQIVSNYNKKLLDAMNYVLIRPSIKKGVKNIPYRYDPEKHGKYFALHELVFNRYVDMFRYFMPLEGRHWTTRPTINVPVPESKGRWYKQDEEDLRKIRRREESQKEK